MDTILLTIAYLAVEILLNTVLPIFLDQMGDMLERLPFIRDFLGALLGIVGEAGEVDRWRPGQVRCDHDGRCCDRTR